VNEQKIIVKIGPDGKVKLEVQGMVGSSCMSVTEALEKALAGGSEAGIERDFKPEFFETEPAALDYNSVGQTEGGF